jgi:predicted nucleotidyltransferase component of viral defense system
MNQQYIDTVRLLLDIAPVIFESPQFALKGGTALNLFIQNLPRLSVDIDVVFTDYQMSRDDALKAISIALKTAKNHIEKRGYSAQLRQTIKGEDIKLVVENSLSQVKVEVNFVFRGVLLPIERQRLVKKAEDIFTTSLELPVLAVPELYGSKLVAAMDR